MVKSSILVNIFTACYSAVTMKKIHDIFAQLNAESERRRIRITALRHAGLTIEAIAGVEGVSKQRIHQLLTKWKVKKVKVGADGTA